VDIVVVQKTEERREVTGVGDGTEERHCGWFG
jgi:adenosine/AMP kinase